MYMCVLDYIVWNMLAFVLLKLFMLGRCMYIVPTQVRQISVIVNIFATSFVHKLTEIFQYSMIFAHINISRKNICLYFVPGVVFNCHRRFFHKKTLSTTEFCDISWLKF